MAKCPNENIICIENPIISQDFRWVYDRRKEWFDKCKTPVYIQEKNDFLYWSKLVGQIVTTGVNAILNILELKPKYLYFGGFDFFTSDLHNIDKKFRRKKWPKCHHFEGEFDLMKYLVKKYDHIDCQPEIKKLFEKEFKNIGGSVA